MEHVINLVNGYILLKCESFKKACQSVNIVFREGNYTLLSGSPYFAGLIDTDGRRQIEALFLILLETGLNVILNFNTQNIRRDCVWIM